MIIERDSFINALTKVKPGLANKEIIEQSTNFIFHENKVFTYNDDIMVSHPLELDIEAAVPAKELYSLISKQKVDEIEIILKDSELLITGGRTKAGIKVSEELTILPLIKEVSIPEAFFTLPKNFAEAVRFCIFSTSKDMSKPALTCIHVKEDIVESCDNYRLTQYKLSKPIKKEFMIPYQPARYIGNMKVKSYTISKNWLHFKAEDNTIISCRTYVDKYPNISSMTKVIGKEIQFPKGIIETLDRVQIFSESEFVQDELIKITLKKDKMLVRGEGDTGWINETLKVKYDGSDLSFWVSPRLIRDILVLLNKTIYGTNNKLKFTGDSFCHIVCLAEEEKKEKEEDTE